MTHWIALVIAMLLNAAANILLKLGAASSTSAPVDGSASFITRVLNFVNLATALGIMFFAVNVLVYRKALDKLAISLAYPIMVSGGLVLVTLAAVMLPQLKEKVSLVQYAGIVLIAIGVWLVAR